MIESPNGLPDYMTGRIVRIDGERYISLRHAVALFTHTEFGHSFYRIHRKRISWDRTRRPRLMFGVEMHEDRPEEYLQTEFGKLKP